MSRRVVKIGGSAIREPGDFLLVAEIIRKYDTPVVVVLSAMNGVTDLILGRTDGIGQSDIEPLCSELSTMHVEVLKSCHLSARDEEKMENRIRDLTWEMRKHLIKLIALDSISGRPVRERIVTYGERFAALLLGGVLNAAGGNCEVLTPEDIGLMADRGPGGGRVDFARSISGVQRCLTGDAVQILPGYYGVSEQDDGIVLLGRGGSDYSAACIAHCMDAPSLDIWKDVPGFMTADPRHVRRGSTIPHLSYVEAAELAYFGASILHPMTLEPVMKKAIPVRVFSCRQRGAERLPFTLIDGEDCPGDPPIKSITFTDSAALLSLHGTTLGFQPGVLSRVTSALSGRGINIKSVLTSQTCISLLLDPDDLNVSSCVLEVQGIAEVDCIEAEDGLALVALVGEGICSQYGIAARAFSAVARHHINVRLVCVGASTAALYFIVAQGDRKTAVQAVHDEFWPDTR